MPTTDVAPLVTPVYTPTLPVTTDGSVLTQADLTTLAVSLGNRIEFVRQLVNTASENFNVTADDFLHVDDGAHTFGSPRIWHGDTPWVATQLAAGTITTKHDDSGGFLDNQGQVIIRSSSGTTGLAFRKGDIGTGAGSGVRFGRVTVMKCLVRLGNIGSPMKFEFGMQANSDTIRASNVASISFLFDPSISPNWQARTSLTAGASEHLTDTGIAAVAGVFRKLTITRTDTGADPTYQFKIGTTVAATKQQSAGTFFIPDTGGGFMRFAAQVPVFATNEIVAVDRVSFELNASGR